MLVGKAAFYTCREREKKESHQAQRYRYWWLEGIQTHRNDK
jgi:hypothetical protein